MNQLAYIFVAQVLIAVMLASILLLCWLKVDRQRHALTWSLAFAVVTVSYGLNLLRDFMPQPVYWSVANAASLTSSALALTGFWQRARLRPRPALLIGAVLIAEALVIWFRVGWVHIGMTMTVVPVFSMLAMWLAAGVLLSRGRKLRAAEWGMVVVLGLFGFAQGAAGGVAAQQGAAGDEHLRELYNQVNFLTMPAAFAGLGMFAVFIIASDLAERLQNLALTDQLTGLTNRRGFWEAAGRALATAERTREPLCIAVADIDDFKSVNDTHGHPVGDQVLAAVARRLMHSLRSSDLIARVGGEEFAMVYPRAEEATAVEVCERQLRALTCSPVRVGQLTVPITCSFGVAEVDRTQTLEEAIAVVDQALYRAKARGGACVETPPPAAGE